MFNQVSGVACYTPVRTCVRLKIKIRKLEKAKQLKKAIKIFVKWGLGVKLLKKCLFHLNNTYNFLSSSLRSLFLLYTNNLLLFRYPIQTSWLSLLYFKKNARFDRAFKS